MKVGEHASDVHDEIVKPLENFVSDHVVVTEKVAVTGGDLFVQKSRIVAGNVEFYHFGVRFERNKLVVERGIAAVTVLVIVRNIDVFLALFRASPGRFLMTVTFLATQRIYKLSFRKKYA